MDQVNDNRNKPPRPEKDYHFVFETKTYYLNEQTLFRKIYQREEYGVQPKIDRASVMSLKLGFEREELLLKYYDGQDDSEDFFFDIKYFCTATYNTIVIEGKMVLQEFDPPTYKKIYRLRDGVFFIDVTQKLIVVFDNENPERPLFVSTFVLTYEQLFYLCQNDMLYLYLDGSNFKNFTRNYAADMLIYDYENHISLLTEEKNYRNSNTNFLKNDRYVDFLQLNIYRRFIVGPFIKRYKNNVDYITYMANYLGRGKELWTVEKFIKNFLASYLPEREKLESFLKNPESLRTINIDSEAFPDAFGCQIDRIFAMIDFLNDVVAPTNELREDQFSDGIRRFYESVTTE